ncbi:MAG: hypothetical protein ACYDIE_13105 [Candidatus Krumholzibacteriia bacterium]
MRSSALLWIVAWCLTLGSAVWQRMTGPTYPVRVRGVVGGAQVRAKLLKSHSIASGLPVVVTAPDRAVAGEVVWHRHPTDEPWRSLPLVREGDKLVATLPAQPLAGKLVYRVVLRRADPAGGLAPTATLPQGDPVVARFKGDVPLPLLLVHVGVIFTAMLWSARAGLETLTGGPRRQRHVAAAAVLMFVGGLILGPFVQKAAFDAYWTGWPIGHDLTDNKVALAMLLWLGAWWQGRGDRRGARGWALAASFVTLVIFVVPHSLFGSQFDYAAVAPPPAPGS